MWEVALKVSCFPVIRTKESILKLSEPSTSRPMAAPRGPAEWSGHSTLSNSVSPCPWMQSKGSHVGFQTI